MMHYWPFLLGIHWLPVDSQHKGPVLQNFVVCLDTLLNKQASGQSSEIPRPSFDITWMTSVNEASHLTGIEATVTIFQPNDVQHIFMMNS